jgi:hypothetical protein
MEIMAGTVAGIPEEGHHKIMVYMDPDVVDLLPGVALPLLAPRMDMVDTAGMEPPIIMDIAVTMVDIVLIMDVGIRVEVEEVRHTMVEEAGLGNCVRPVFDTLVYCYPQKVIVH